MSDYPKKAFPYEESYMNHGMDLRDYFAAKAMQSIIIYEEGDFNLKLIAEESYRMADAMMKARKK